MKKNGFASIVILLAVLMAVVAGGGIWYYRTRQPPSSPPMPTTTASNSAVAPCSEFNQLSSFVSANVFDPTLNIQNFTALDSAFSVNPPGAFLWKRKATEPFISYPLVAVAVTSTYGYELDDKTIQAEMNFASADLSNNLPQEIIALGLTPNGLNTLPLSSNEGGLASQQVFGFTKGDDLYSVVLSSEEGQQAPGGVEMTTACARPDAAYDKFYDALAVSVDTSTQASYDKDFIEVATTSPDGTVYELWGATNYVGIADYYYFNGSSSPQLVSSGSSPADCFVLEQQKVGQGMTCWNGAYPLSTVTYATSSAPTVESPSSTTSSLSGWNTYSFSGYTFKYPPDWTAREDIVNDTTTAMSLDVDYARLEPPSSYESPTSSQDFNGSNPRILIGDFTPDVAGVPEASSCLNPETGLPFTASDTWDSEFGFYLHCDDSSGIAVTTQSNDPYVLGIYDLVRKSIMKSPSSSTSN